MMDLQLAAVANQTIAAMLDGARFELTVRAAEGCVAVDVVRDNVTIVTASRALPDYPVIPFPYLQSKYGNFIFITENDELPDWQKFGITHFLCYVTVEDIANMGV